MFSPVPCLRQGLFLCFSLAAVTLTGCTHQTLIVTDPTATAPTLPGLPFYAKHGVCKTESVWLEPQYTISLTIKVDGELPIQKTVVVNRKAYVGGDVQNVLSALSELTGEFKIDEAKNASKCPSSVGAIWDRVAANPSDAPVNGLDLNGGLQIAEKEGNVFRVGNTASIGTEVDYTKTLYINSKSPWIGTGQVDAKLDSDGTLTEASAKVDDETWSTILNTVSSLAGDFFGAGSGSAAAPATASTASSALIEIPGQEHRAPASNYSCRSLAGWPNPKTSVSYKYKVQTTVYKHDHTAVLQLAQLDHNQCIPDDHGVLGGSFTVAVQDAGTKEKGDDPNSISVNGVISLPKKDAVPKKKDSADK